MIIFLKLLSFRLVKIRNRDRKKMASVGQSRSDGFSDLKVMVSRSVLIHRIVVQNIY